MNNISPKERLKQIFESTIDSGLRYTEKIEDIDFYTLLCKSTANNQLYKIFNCNLTMFNYKFEDEESVLIVFAIPTSIPLDNKNKQENKHISEKIFDILKIIEECFITIDFMDLKNIKEDKFTYIVVVKKI